MKTAWLLAGALLASGDALAATYTYTGNHYSTVIDYTSCDTGPCANYTTAMGIVGSFDTASPLAPNLSADVTSSVTSYSFSDGLNTYTSADPNGRAQIVVNTDASGNITAAAVSLLHWFTTAVDHTGDRFNMVVIQQGGDGAWNNALCTDGPDFCLGFNPDNSTSEAGAAYGTWSVTAVPVLAPWALAVMAAGLAGVGARRVRRGPQP